MWRAILIQLLIPPFASHILTINRWNGDEALLRQNDDCRDVEDRNFGGGGGVGRPYSTCGKGGSTQLVEGSSSQHIISIQINNTNKR